MARYLRREPWFATWSTLRNGPGGHWLKLPRWPIQSLTSITEGTGDSPSTVTASTYEIGGNQRRDRVYREDGWSFNYEAAWRPYVASGGAPLIYTAAYSAIKIAKQYGGLDASLKRILTALEKKAMALFTKGYTMRSRKPKQARRLWSKVLRMVPPKSRAYQKAYEWLNNSGKGYQDEDED